MGKPEKIHAIRGMHDILPPHIDRWQWVEAKARNLFARYGYGEIRTPVVEETQLFSRSIGEVTDIVEKEMYTFPDRKGKHLTLRPEGTASVVRAVLEAGLLGSDPEQSPVQKFYYIGPMFRYERPQKGRQRQFHQIGAEVFGDPTAKMDAEVLALCAFFLEELGLSKFVTLEINTLGSLASRPHYVKALQDYFGGFKDQLCGDCLRRLEQNPLRILDCKVETCAGLKKNAPLLSAYLDDESRAHFAAVQEYLQILNIPFTINERMVRGLDYYTQTTFEFVTTELGAQGAVLAGGRYDRLVADLGGAETPAIGFASGLERLILLLEKIAPDFKAHTAAKVFVAGLGDAACKMTFQLEHELRRRGVITYSEQRTKSLKALLRQADRLQAEWVVIAGDQELQKKAVMLKDMRGGTQAEIAYTGLNDLVDQIHARLTPA